MSNVVVEDNIVGETGDVEEIKEKVPNVSHDDDSTPKEDNLEKEASVVAEKPDEASIAKNIKSDPKAEVEQKIDNSSTTSPEEPNEASNDFRAVDAEGWEDLLGSGRLRKRVIVEGDPKNHPAKGFQVKIHFKGSFQDQVFEEREIEFCVQENEVISALNLVLPLMNMGEKCEIISDPEFAYGSVGFPPVLPPNAAIHAEVTLLECRPGPVITELPLEERKVIGHRKKERGNFWYSRQDYSNAVQCYRRAVEYFDDEKLELEAPIDRFSLEPELQELLQDRLKTFNNLAQAQMKLESWEAALASLRNVLKIEPNNEKALYRKAKCLEERGQIEESIGILRRVTRLYPDNKTSKADLTRLTERRKKNRLAEEQMSKRMLGLNVDNKKSVEKKKTGSGFLSNSQWITVGVIMGGAGVLLGGLLSWFKVHI